MKRFYDSVCRFFSNYGLAIFVGALFLVPQVAFAGDNITLLDDVSRSLQANGKQLVKLVRVISILAGFASAIMVVVNLLKQERDSVTKAIFWALGVVAAFAITAALNTALGSLGA